LTENKISNNKNKNFSFDKSDGFKICIIIASTTGNGDMPDNGE
jgi:hypothetical protein